MMLAAAFPDRYPGPNSPAPARKRPDTGQARAPGRAGGRKTKPGAVGPSTGRRGAGGEKEAEARAEVARAIWRAAAPAPDTPAAAYLIDRRQCWPPPDVGPPLPTSVRWLGAGRAPPRGPGWGGFRADAAGAVVYGLAAPEFASRFPRAVEAVHLEALDGRGRRVIPRWRRTIGPAGGRVFQSAEGDVGAEVVLAEGPVDALALALVRPGARVLAVVGREYGGAVRAVLAMDSLQPIIIEGDGGPEGQAAAGAARREARRIGGRVRVAWRDPGDRADPAEELAFEFHERAAIIEHCGGLARGAAERGAWQGIIGAALAGAVRGDGE